MTVDPKAPRRALGRGLDALLPAAPPAGFADKSVFLCPVEKITPQAGQPRQHFDEAELGELTASIREHGIIEPLVVRRLAKDADTFELIAGERRWRAAQRAGLKEVLVVVKDVSPKEAFELALVENVQRADLNPLEEAAAYQALVEEFGLTQEVVAGRVGKSRVAVTNSMRLLRLPTPAKEAVIAGTIKEGHARALLGLPGDELIEQALAVVIADELTVRQTEELVRRLARQAAEPPREEQIVEEEVSPETRQLETSFREALGTKVNLYRSRRGGRIVIHFFSEEELSAIYDQIVGPSDL